MSYPPFDKVEDAPLGIKLMDSGVESRVQMLFSPTMHSTATAPDGQEYPVMTGFSILSDLPDAELLQDKVTGLPPRPKTMPIPSLKDDMNNPGLVSLSDRQFKDTTSGSFLMSKITLEKPQNMKNFTFTEAVRAIAKAGKCNIVTEDFTSQKAQEHQGISNSLNATAENTVLNMLNTFNGSAWFINENDRLIVGWQNSQRKTWRDHHTSMLPEEYLNELKTKLNGDGLKLEDAIHLSNLPEPSAIEWLVYTDDFQNLYEWHIDPAWKLYDTLVEQDKQLAKSSDGLPLGKFDSTWIADFFHTGKMQQGPSPESTFQESTESDIEAQRDNTKQNNSALSDPAVISTMLMRVQKKPAESRLEKIGGAGVSVSIPEGLNLSSYEMVITYTLNGEGRSMLIQSPFLAFPIWSPKREAEIIKALATDGK